MVEGDGAEGGGDGLGGGDGVVAAAQGAGGPTSGNPSADCLGVVNDAAEFALWLSPHILVNTCRVLASVLKMPDDEIDEYLAVLAGIAEASGAGITDPPQVVGVVQLGDLLLVLARGAGPLPGIDLGLIHRAREP